MLYNKTDLTKHIPKSPFLKGVIMVCALIGLAGLGLSFTHAELAIESAINNVIGTFRELRITTDGSPSGSTKIILGTGGIWVDSGALGGPTEGVLRLNSLGYVTRGLIGSGDIAPGSITTGMLSFTLTGGGSSGAGTTTVTCPAGEVLAGITSGVPTCVPIISAGSCGSSGILLGWSSTGVIICGDFGSGGDFSASGASLWHISPIAPSNIYYGTVVDDENGNVGVGLENPLAKLHVKGPFRVDTSGEILYPDGSTTPAAATAFFVTGARVGINNFTPEGALDVVGKVRFSSYGGLGVRNLGVDSLGNLVVMPSSITASGYWRDGGAGVIYYSGGDVGIGTSTPGATLHVNGDILTDSVYIISDETLKENIVKITDPMDKIMNLNGYTFDWISNGRHDVGLLAQEVEAVFPQLVKTQTDGKKSVQYPNLMGLVIEAIKSLNATVEDLRTDYADITTIQDMYDQYTANRDTIADLSARLDMLENNRDSQDETTTQGIGYYMCVQGRSMGINLDDVKEFCNQTYLPFIDTRNALRLSPEDQTLQGLYDSYLADMETFFSANGI